MSSDVAPPVSKKMKVEEMPAITANCKHFVTRKKRFCKMTVAKGKEYCGEHLPNTTESSHEDSYIPEDKKSKRIPCPLDPKHTVYEWNVAKHLKICNAKKPAVLPAYICTGINLGDDDNQPDGPDATSKLSEVADSVLNGIIGKINKIYVDHIENNISESFLSHDSMTSELAKDIYGPETLKHLIQTSSILGHLRDLEFLRTSTSFVEFGAGKGHLSFWLAQVIKEQAGASNVILVDRASHRHKQDNKVEEREVVHRIRADIADLDLRHLDECRASPNLVGVSKHLCGAATDLAIRCLLNDGGVNGETDDTTTCRRTKGLVIALCCHHRCEWRPFVGKEFLLANGIGRDEFAIITKMVSWAICGSGMSRETRKAIAEKQAAEAEGDREVQKTPEKKPAACALSRNEKETIGKQCKRVLDYARVHFLRAQGFKSRLNYFVSSDVTLENVCIVGIRS